MHTALTAIVFVFDVALPIFLLRRFRSAWPWHVLAVAAAVAIGFAPGTALLNSVPGTFVYGSVVMILLILGFGGLIGLGHKKEKNPALQA